jgi:hypothetical protein
MSTAENQKAVDYLEENKGAWRHSYPVSGNLIDMQVPDTSTTFFRGVRSSSTLRLYGWGSIGMFQPTVASGVGVDFVNFTFGYGTGPPIFASVDAEDQVFPNLTPPSGIRRWSLHAPNTEEFLVRGAVHDPLQDVVSISGFVEPLISAVRPVEFLVACTSDGALYSCGRLILSRDLAATISTPNVANSRPTGFGPDFPTTGPGFSLEVEESNKVRQHALQRVYGPDGDFLNRKFVKVAANDGNGASYSGLAAALDADGYLWFAGDSRGVAHASGFASNTDFHSYFEKYTVSEWRENAGAIVTGGPLLFKDFWMSGPEDRFSGLGDTDPPRAVLLALTHDDRLFQVGRSGSTLTQIMGSFADRAGLPPESLVFHEVTGFVDEIEVTNAGSGYTSEPGVSIGSAGADGRTATAVAIRDAATNTITHVRITNSGWGYTSAPTVTFSGGGGSGAAATAKLFDRKWKTAAVAYTRRFIPVAAICENGVLYTWGDSSIRNEKNPTSLLFHTAAFRITPIRANAYDENPAAVFEKVALNYTPVDTGIESFGAAIDVDGTAYYWGSHSVTTNTAGVTPDAVRVFSVTPLSTADATLGAFKYIDVACSAMSVALVREDNSVWTYGRIDNFINQTELCRGPALGRGRGTYPSDVSSGSGRLYKKIGKVVGANVWTRVFNVGRNAYMAARLPEELDPMYGTRINPLPPYQAPAP